MTRGFLVTQCTTSLENFLNHSLTHKWVRDRLDSSKQIIRTIFLIDWLIWTVHVQCYPFLSHRDDCFLAYQSISNVCPFKASFTKQVQFKYFYLYLTKPSETVIIEIFVLNLLWFQNERFYYILRRIVDRQPEQWSRSQEYF